VFELVFSTGTSLWVSIWLTAFWLLAISWCMQDSSSSSFFRYVVRLSTPQVVTKYLTNWNTVTVCVSDLWNRFSHTLDAASWQTCSPSCILTILFFNKCEYIPTIVAWTADMSQWRGWATLLQVRHVLESPGVHCRSVRIWSRQMLSGFCIILVNTPNIVDSLVSRSCISLLKLSRGECWLGQNCCNRSWQEQRWRSKARWQTTNLSGTIRVTLSSDSVTWSSIDSIQIALDSFNFLAEEDSTESIDDHVTESDDSLTRIVPDKFVVCQRALLRHLCSCHDLLQQFRPNQHSPLDSFNNEIQERLANECTIFRVLSSMMQNPESICLDQILTDLQCTPGLSSTWRTCSNVAHPLHCDISAVQATMVGMYSHLLKNKIVRIQDGEQVCQEAASRVCEKRFHKSDTHTVTVFQFVRYFVTTCGVDNLTTYLKKLDEERKSAYLFIILLLCTKCISPLLYLIPMLDGRW
jgi:hypothetical protein